MSHKHRMMTFLIRLSNSNFERQQLLRTNNRKVLVTCHCWNLVTVFYRLLVLCFFLTFSFDI